MWPGCPAAPGEQSGASALLRPPAQDGVLHPWTVTRGKASGGVNTENKSGPGACVTSGPLSERGRAEGVAYNLLGWLSPLHMNIRFLIKPMGPVE